jgi:MFS transporter, SP family, general alpha glucoside:H+ symporter
LECFKGTNWRRTRIILYANGLSQFIGATFFTNGPYFLILAGVSPVHTSMLVEIGIAIGIFSSLVVFFLLGVVGRRPLILTGTVISGALYFAMAVAGSIVPQNPSCLWYSPPSHNPDSDFRTIGICLQLIPLVFAPAVGPAMSIAGEVSSTRLRAKSQSIGFMFNFFFSTVWNVVVPYMFNPNEGNLGGRMGWIFFTTSILAAIIIFLEFPETKDRTYAELDEMFLAKVPTRTFKSYNPHGFVA